MTVLATELLNRSIRWARNRIAPGAAILVYHRVTELPSDPQLMCVTPRNFEDHLASLRSLGHPVSLEALVEALRSGRPLGMAVVVTFDDGYVDNLCHAKPLLEQNDIPATVFVTAGHIGQQEKFWWDQLEELLLQPGTLPKVFRLEVNGTTREWDLAEWATYSESDYNKHRHWNILDNSEPTTRHKVYRALCTLLRPLSYLEQATILAQTRAQATGQNSSRSSHQRLSEDELRRLAKGGIVNVGAHTLTHSVLANLDADHQQIEIQGCKSYLEGVLESKVTSFAYPYGTRLDYSMDTVKIVQSSGFECSCANFGAPVYRGADRYQLPRILVRDWDGAEFVRRLKYWID